MLYHTGYTSHETSCCGPICSWWHFGAALEHAQGASVTVVYRRTTSEKQGALTKELLRARVGPPADDRARHARACRPVVIVLYQEAAKSAVEALSANVYCHRAVSKRHRKSCPAPL